VVVVKLPTLKAFTVTSSTFPDLNLLDWSSRNLLAVSLGAHVYLWNASNGEINQLLEMEEEDTYVASVSWTKDGHCLAVGSNTGDIQVREFQLQ
jgi:cell division cycle protein 20 (cofactor of APC complex)